MEFFKLTKIFMFSMCIVSCGSPPKQYELDGSDVPGYSKNEYYGSIVFSRPRGLPSYTRKDLNVYYNDPRSYLSFGSKGLTSNLGVAYVLPFLIRPTVDRYKSIDILVQETGVLEKDTLTFKIRKFNGDRQLKRINHNFSLQPFEMKDKLYAETLFPDLFWIDCGKKHRFDTIEITPYDVDFIRNYVKVRDVPKNIRDEAMKNTLFITFIDFEGCLKAGENGQVH